MFMEKEPPDAKTQTPVFGIPGMTEWATCGSGPVRGMETMNGSLFVVSGSGLYSISSLGTVAQLGSSIIKGLEPVSMAENGTQLVIVNGTAGYIYDQTAGTLSQITAAAFYPANTVTFYDNYFVFDRAGTNQFFISGLLNGNSYNGLDFASAESSAKNIVGIVQNLQLLYIFSEDHFEVWYDAGTASFPFQRYTGGIIWRGCGSAHSIIKQNEVIFFLGNDGIFYRIQGSTPVRISTHAIETLIATETDQSSISCFTETLEGHKFVHVVLPNVKRTVSFDTTTQLWHERSSCDENSRDLGRWRVNCAIDTYGMTLYGDFYDGVISKRDWNVYTERGNTIKALLHSKPYHEDKLRVFCRRFEADMETGVGLNTGQGSDPQIMLRYSKDGGKTWSQLQQWRSLGQIGEYLKRLRWLRLGSAYQWVFELTISDAVKRVLIGAHADFEAGLG
jgi:hypothetical protein